MRSSCFGHPTWKHFGGFPRKACWSALESPAIAYYDSFAGQFYQRDASDPAVHLPTVLMLDAKALDFKRLACMPGGPACTGAEHPNPTPEPSLRVLRLRSCWQRPKGMDLTVVRRGVQESFALNSPPSQNCFYSTSQRN